MRKLLILSLMILVWSCSIDDGSEDNFHFEILPIEAVDLPNMLEGGNLNRINYSYYLPTNCHGYNDLYYVENGNQRTLAVVTTVMDAIGGGLSCEPLVDVLDEREFEIYVPLEFNAIIFNFWQGEDENGDDIYLTIEVPVSQ